jgi:CopG family transcriptional regulator, nickel-responsive regulator
MMILKIIILLRKRNIGLPNMERITVTIDNDLLENFDKLIKSKGYANRSEGIRDAVRQMLSDQEMASDEDANCVGCVVYAYNHHERALSSRLVEVQHHHHEVQRATLHLHIDRENCVEATVLNGSIRDVKRQADQITSQTGVKHGRLHLIPIDKNPFE